MEGPDSGGGGIGIHGGRGVRIREWAFRRRD